MSLTSFGTGYPQTVHTAVKYQATIFYIGEGGVIWILVVQALCGYFVLIVAQR